MSLDIYLSAPTTCPHCGGELPQVSDYDANITHNLGAMADEAGIYKHLWHPEQVGVKLAEHLIEPLDTAIKLMKADPVRFRKFDAPNKWGTYEDFVPWLENLLEACRACPGASVRVSI